MYDGEQLKVDRREQAQKRPLADLIAQILRGNEPVSLLWLYLFALGVALGAVAALTTQFPFGS